MLKKTTFFYTAFLLTCCLVYGVMWGYNLQTNPDGIYNSDFLATYTALQILHTGQGELLYDLDLQRTVQHSIFRLTVPPVDLLPFIHPPFYLLPLYPLGFLPYRTAYFSMMLLNLILLSGTLMGLKKMLRLPKMPLILLACFAFFPLIVNLIQGQNALISLLIMAVGTMALREQRDAPAGAVLALGLYKPQLVLVVAGVLFFKRRWWAIVGFGLMAVVLIGVSFLMIGWPGMLNYVELTLLHSPLTDGAYGVNYERMHNWRALFRLWLGPNSLTLVNGLTAIFSGVTVVLLIPLWYGSWLNNTLRFQRHMALTLIATMLISPHLNTHDLTLWILIGLLLWDAAARTPMTFGYGFNRVNLERVVGVAIPLSFISLALQAVIQLPLTTLFMAGVFAWLWLDDRASP